MKCSTHGCERERYESKTRRSRYCAKCRTAVRLPKMDGCIYVPEYRPPIPEGACVKWRDGCMSPAVPGEDVCASCLSFYRRTGRASGYGETDEQASRNALARMRFEEVS